MALKAEATSSIGTALHVMATERAALQHLETLYQTDARAQQDLARAVDLIAQTIRHGGKLVVCGVGKSGKIARKIEATMNSLGIYCTYLHPTEALHGDLGMIRPNDTMLLISFSGRSPELLCLLPYIPTTVPIIALSSHTNPDACPLLSLHGPLGTGILLSAPIHEREEVSLGLSAPTSSTTVALCLGDALAIAIGRKLHTQPGRGPAEVFRGYHPGGAIGAAAGITVGTGSAATTPATPSTAPSTSSGVSSSSACDSPSSSISMPWEELSNGSPIPPLTLQSPPERTLLAQESYVPIDLIPTALPPYTQLHPSKKLRILDLLLTAIQHPTAKSWVFLSKDELIPPRRIRALLSKTPNVDQHVSDVVVTADSSPQGQPLAVPRANWFVVAESTPLTELQRLVSTSRNGPDPIAVIAVVKDLASPTSYLGVMEAEDLWTG
ncbi:Arabinose 5-phosphate isomerase KdsD [Penicillium diatomitis]|uniref:Arabinose 5-phosphate isomerase KdsD n=1 Tax=Penicillium diatomitis TaxID=2819901 RepID=A0A9W9XMW5_9EURO|nr:Arabinose 5-phosphate isomerase KdsD [Penicillium diatomitis]KAJ5495897.1 Arabinose 5-phosphate isomerase KdsD [Penicillium diatomitis]